MPMGRLNAFTILWRNCYEDAWSLFPLRPGQPSYQMSNWLLTVRMHVALVAHPTLSCLDLPLQTTFMIYYLTPLPPLLHSILQRSEGNYKLFRQPPKQPMRPTKHVQPSHPPYLKIHWRLLQANSPW
jgi:hypothetical protein